jgi:hypothetical protein|tara:strand:- start:151 stop:777 length:627 start_codon:yes stop_codon:yes gene_type:complete
MEKLIETVLEELRDTNLHSAAGRQAIVKAIMKEIRSGKGFFLNMNSIDGERVPGETDKEEQAKWICEHCGESTFEVEYDYIGSNYNHLQCDLKKTKHFADDFHEGKDGDNNYVYSGDLKDVQQQAYNELSADGLPPGGDAQATRDANKLAEEIAGGSVELGYIFESPDRGETLYRRKVGESKRELISKEEFKEYTRNRHGVQIDDTKK